MYSNVFLFEYLINYIYYKIDKFRCRIFLFLHYPTNIVGKKNFQSSPLSNFYLMVRLEVQKWKERERTCQNTVLIEKQIRYLSQGKKKDGIR